jgi:Ribbon-helix-helix protein, copG family
MRACYPRLVRTTISLPDALFERAKKVARTEGVTLSQLVEAALRDRLFATTPAEKIRPFRLVTFGSGGTHPGVSFDNLKQYVDDEDAARLTTRAGRAADGDDVDP